MSNTEMMTRRIATLDAVTAAYTAFSAAQANATAQADALKAAQKAKADKATISALNKAKTGAEADAIKAATEYRTAREAQPEAAHLLDAHNSVRQAESGIERATAHLDAVTAQADAIKAELPALTESAAKAAAKAQTAEDTLSSARTQNRKDRATKDGELILASNAQQEAAQKARDTAKSESTEANRLAQACKAQHESFYAPSKTKTGTPNPTAGSVAKAQGELDTLLETLSSARQDVTTCTALATTEANRAEVSELAVNGLKIIWPNLSSDVLEFAERYAKHVAEGSADYDLATKALAGYLHKQMEEALRVAMRLNPKQRLITAELAVGLGHPSVANPANVSELENLTHTSKKEDVNGKPRNRAHFGRDDAGKVTKADAWKADAETTYIGMKITSKYRQPGTAKLLSSEAIRGQYKQAKELQKREAANGAAIDAAPIGRIKRPALTVDAEQTITDTAPLDLTAAEATATQNEGHAAD